jgi:hypothetical protein
MVIAQPTSPVIPATIDGVLKIPAPMTMPTIMATAPRGLSKRRGEALELAPSELPIDRLNGAYRLLQ